MHKYASLMSLDAYDPLPKLGEKVVVKSEPTAAEMKAKKLSDFERGDHSTQSCFYTVTFNSAGLSNVNETYGKFGGRQYSSARTSILEQYNAGMAAKIAKSLGVSLDDLRQSIEALPPTKPTFPNVWPPKITVGAPSEAPAPKKYTMASDVTSAAHAAVKRVGLRSVRAYIEDLGYRKVVDLITHTEPMKYGELAAAFEAL
jgi:hypothetical protein